MQTNLTPNRYEGGLRLKGTCKNPHPDKPLITIITVVFNGAHFLEGTINSVLNQPYGNIEYIIIDGCSTDNTLEIIEKYEDKIDYWLSEKDRGIYDAMNKGWKVANDNGLILFLGAGDKIISLPADKTIFNTENVVFGKVYLGNERSYNATADFRLKLGNTLHSQALIIPKVLHHNPPFNISYGRYADFDLNQRLLKRGVTFVFCNEFSAYAAPNGITSKFIIREMLRIVMKNYGLYWSFVATLYYIYQGLKYGFGKFSIER